jgi:hypothetical protein
MNVTKNELHDLIEALPESETPAAKRFLQLLLSKTTDPLLQALLTAPADDEPLDDQDLQDIAEAEQAIAKGKVHSWEEVKKEFGL